MPFLADFHIHSHHSVATSKDCDPENLFLWACIKGLTLIGTGDFTHPGWLEELQQKLIPAEEGLFRLRSEWERAMLDRIPRSCHREVRFLLSSEISSIYKKGGRTRKVHNCLLVPSFDEAKAIAESLERIGNIRADGRPILGLDSRNLLEIMLEKSNNGIFIPAHIWTPHFSLFGAYSGFDRLQECFEDLSSHIFALETGLSSDPSMNWRVSALDNYRLVSNSDAHSPKNLAREANIFQGPLSFPALRSALAEKGSGRFLGTVEFFPQEGKYHYDGHRACGIRLSPEETIALEGICPTCGRKLTLGVMHRVVELVDRPAGFRPEGAAPFHSIIPLPEILADYFGCGVSAKKVHHAYFSLIQKLGPEWEILMLTPAEELKRHMGTALAEGIERVRTGRVSIRPGFDGEYGTISVFSAQDRSRMTQKGLFAENREVPDLPAAKPQDDPPPLTGKRPDMGTRQLQMGEDTPLYGQLNPAQLECVRASEGPILVIAGPGTGKTHTLAFRIAHLIREEKIKPDSILAVTFTNKAAREMSQRLQSLLDIRPSTCRPFIGTFHHFCLGVLKQYSTMPGFTLFHTYDSLAVLDLILKGAGNGTSLKPKDCLQRISRIKAQRGQHAAASDEDPALIAIYGQYRDTLAQYGAFDYDDLILETVRLLEEDRSAAEEIRAQFTHILVDEFQDVNSIQYTLVMLLAAEHSENLFLIGDPNQAIYGFRGADDRLFFRTKEDFPRSQIFPLSENYRSYARILDSASQVISRNPQAIPVKLQAMRGEGPLIRLLELPTEKAEGIAIVKEIGSLMGGIDMLQADGASEGMGHSREMNGYTFSDFAILFRAGHQADILEECLVTEGIPYRLAGRQDIMENLLVRQVLAFLRWCHSPLDEHSFLQAMDLPFFSVAGEAKRKILSSFRDSSHESDNDGANAASQFICRLRKDFGMERMADTLCLYRQIAGETAPAPFIRQVIALLGECEMAEGHQKDLERLCSLAEEFPDTSSFLDGVSLHREGDISWRGSTGRPGTEMVSLMTIHAAKGLEFPVVFICGCEDGLLPYRSPHGETHPCEERRVFYVGMTRAKDRLYLSWCKNRMRRGKREQMQISSFLEEIPEAFCEKTSFTLTAPQKPRVKQLGLW